MNEDNGANENRHIPEVVTLRDIYQLADETKDRVTAMSVQVDNLCKGQEDQKKENQRLWSAISKTRSLVHNLKIRVYSVLGGVAVLTFMVANWSTVSAMME